MSKRKRKRKPTPHFERDARELADAISTEMTNVLAPWITRALHIAFLAGVTHGEKARRK